MCIFLRITRISPERKLFSPIAQDRLIRPHNDHFPTKFTRQQLIRRCHRQIHIFDKIHEFRVFTALKFNSSAPSYEKSSAS